MRRHPIDPFHEPAAHWNTFCHFGNDWITYRNVAVQLKKLLPEWNKGEFQGTLRFATFSTTLFVQAIRPVLNPWQRTAGCRLRR